MRRLEVSAFCKVTWLAVLVAVTGCHKQKIPLDPPTLPYKVNGAKDPTIKSMEEHFNRKGVRVISIGQDYLISIPSSALFPEESPQLRWKSYSLLNALACYLKEFRKIAINVTAYSDKCVSVTRERALTLARARAVGDYLWSQGIESRFVFTQGLGSDKPIVAITKIGDKSPNSRIEITFREAVA